MADPVGNYLAGLGFLGGPALNPNALSPEQLAALGLDKAIPAPGIGVETYPQTERGLASLQNMSDLGRYAVGGINPDEVPQGQLADKAMKAIMDINNIRMPNAEPGSAGSFGGRLAAGWPSENLPKYAEMRDAGYSPSSIYQETGLFRTGDRMLKFEIPDTGSSLTNSVVNALMRYEPGTKVEGRLSTILNHPELYENYPGMKDLPTSVNILKPQPSGAMNYEGLYNPRAKSIDAQSSYLEGPKGIQSVLLHEAAHHIQGLENFAKGSSPTYERQLGQNLIDRIDAQRSAEAAKDGPDPDMLDRLYAMKMEFMKKFKPFDAYQRSAGEVDARTIQSRMQMTPWQLQNISPADTAAGLVPFQNQIVRFGW